MNYFDLIPEDVMKIINRKVKDQHIIDRRIQRKQNRKINREQKASGIKKRNIYERFYYLYRKYQEKEEERKNEERYKVYSINIDKQNEECEIMRDILLSRNKHIYDIIFCIGGEEAYLEVIFLVNGVFIYDKVNKNNLKNFI